MYRACASYFHVFLQRYMLMPVPTFFKTFLQCSGVCVKIIENVEMERACCFCEVTGVLGLRLGLGFVNIFILKIRYRSRVLS